MAHILATWELGRGYGHLSSLAPLAQALGSRGHTVSIAARDAALARSIAPSPFARVVDSPRHRPAPPKPTLTYAAVIADGGFDEPAAAEALVRAWLAIFDAERPAALVTEHAPISLLAAHVAGLPAVRMGIGFTVPPAGRPFPSLLPWERADDAARAAADAPADAVVRHVCRAFGAPPLDGLAELLGRVPPFLATWPELDIYGARPGATYYGPLGGFGGAARPDWPAAEGLRTLVYLHADSPAGPALRAALARLGWPAIWHGSPFPAPPASVAVSAEPLDIPALLEGAALLVSRASHATLCQGLQAGKPLLMLPDTLETLLLSARMTRLGLGLLVRRGADAAVLADAFRALAAGDGFAPAAKAAAARYAAYRPVAAAAELARDIAAALGL